MFEIILLFAFIASTNLLTKREVISAKKSLMMKDLTLFFKIFKFLYFCLPLFFLPKKNLKVYDVINCLNENLVTYFV